MRRIKIFGKGPLDFGLERVRRSVELGKPPLVDRVGRMVVRRERDVALVVKGEGELRFPAQGDARQLPVQAPGDAEGDLR